MSFCHSLPITERNKFEASLLTFFVCGKGCKMISGSISSLSISTFSYTKGVHLVCSRSFLEITRIPRQGQTILLLLIANHQLALLMFFLTSIESFKNLHLKEIKSLLTKYRAGLVELVQNRIVFSRRTNMYIRNIYKFERVKLFLSNYEYRTITVSREMRKHLLRPYRFRGYLSGGCSGFGTRRC